MFAGQEVSGMLARKRSWDFASHIQMPSLPARLYLIADEMIAARAL